MSWRVLSEVRLGFKIYNNGVKSLRLHPWNLWNSHGSYIIVVVFGVTREVVSVQAAPDPVVAFEDIDVSNPDVFQQHSNEEASDAGPNDADLAGVRFGLDFFGKLGSRGESAMVAGASFIQLFEEVLMQNML